MNPLNVIRLSILLALTVCPLGRTVRAQDYVLYSLWNGGTYSIYHVDFCTGDIKGDGTLCLPGLLKVTGLTFNQQGLMFMGLGYNYGEVDTSEGKNGICHTLDFEVLDSLCCVRDFRSPDFCNWQALCSDRHPYGAWAAGRCLVKVISKREGNIGMPGKWISKNFYKGSFGDKAMHSLTYRAGKLYGIHLNEFYEIDTIDPSQSRLLWKFPIDVSDFTTIPYPDKDTYSHLHLATVETECGEWRTYLFVGAVRKDVGPYRVGIHQLDIRTGETHLIKDMSGVGFFEKILGQAFYPGKADCNLILDLDGDDNTMRPPIDFYWSGCPQREIPVADKDVLFTHSFRGPLDSITLELRGVLDVGEERLIASSCPGIRVVQRDDLHMTLINEGSEQVRDFLDCIRAIRLLLTANPPSDGVREVHFMAYTCNQVSKESVAYLELLLQGTAGEDNGLSLCPVDTVIDLRDLLSPGHSLRGRWEPKGPILHIPEDKGGKYCYIVGYPGCFPDTACIDLYVSQSPNLNLPEEIRVCDRQSVRLDAGTGGTSYLWSTGAHSSRIEVETSGLYWVEVENEEGCRFRDSTEVRIGSSSYVDLGDIELCEGDSLMLGNRVYRDSGLHELVLKNASDCDSITSFRILYYPRIKSVIEGDTLRCEGDTLVLTANPNLKGLRWSTGDTTSRIRVTHSGTYTLRGVDAHGCSIEDSINLRLIPAPQVNVRFYPEKCKGENNGSIEIVKQQADEELKYFVNGVETDSTTILHLAPGHYNVIIRNKAGCARSISGDIPAGTDLEVDLGPDIELHRTDTTLYLKPGTLVGTVDSIRWYVDGALYAEGNSSISFMPSGHHTIRIIVTDENGCRTIDELEIFIKTSTKLYIPNTFTPNADNLNDRFEVFSEYKNVKILEMRIYDRWGEVIYIEKNFVEGRDKKRFWDGTFKGKDCRPGVYVYQLHYQFSDGSEGRRAGSITLIR